MSRCCHPHRLTHLCSCPPARSAPASPGGRRPHRVRAGRRAARPGDRGRGQTLPPPRGDHSHCPPFHRFLSQILPSVLWRAVPGEFSRALRFQRPAVAERRAPCCALPPETEGGAGALCWRSCAGAGGAYSAKILRFPWPIPWWIPRRIPPARRATCPSRWWRRATTCSTRTTGRRVGSGIPFRLRFCRESLSP